MISDSPLIHNHKFSEIFFMPVIWKASRLYLTSYLLSLISWPKFMNLGRVFGSRLDIDAYRDVILTASLSLNLGLSPGILMKIDLPC